jgi:protein-S-isoprenylcysteine O-methyltransferase Ste14
MTNRGLPWWKGTRGEWWVAGQGALLAALVFVPAAWEWPALSGGAWRAIGGVLTLAGLAFAVRAMIDLGPNLTPFPTPRPDGTLVRSGLYEYARHPIYGGLIVAAFGWALWRQSGGHVLLAVALAFYMNAKASFEERRLIERFPEYRDYRARTKRLLPWIF